MKKNSTQFLIGAAVAGIIGAGALGSVSVVRADDADAKGHCMGANACKGKGGCAQAKSDKTKGNDCAGKNGCKGKGFVEKTKAECDAMAKKSKHIRFEAAEPKAEAKSS